MSILDTHDYFWRLAMQFDLSARAIYLCGDTRVIIVGERGDVLQALGWRYTAVQVRDCLTEHAGVPARGGEEGRPPTQLGDTVRYSFVRDPDGNFIELSNGPRLVGRLT
jgi:lactoylglutathione lyase